MNHTTLTGTVIRPGDPRYEELRRSNNLYFSYYPEVIVYPHNTIDVVNAVNYAREHNLNIRCKCGGHNYEAFCVANKSMVIDVTKLVGFNLDTKQGIVKIGSGFLQADLYPALDKFGFGFNGGSCGGVGVAGYLLGAGVGFFHREQGMGSDNVIEIEMVNYKGEVIVCNDYQNSDLFYALRGAGANNFGVITSFTVKVYPVSEVTLMYMTWPKSKAAEVVEVFQRISPYIDNSITFKLNMKKGVIEFASVTTFPDVNFTLEQFKQLSDISDKIYFEVKTVPYLDYIIEYGGVVTPPEYYKRTGVFAYNPISTRDVDVIYDYIDNYPQAGGPAVIGYIALGGKILENEGINSCFPHRRAQFLMQIEANWTAADNNRSCELIKWAENLRCSLYSYSAPAFVNYPDICLKDYNHAYFAYNVPRLKEIKAKYNPSNLFDFQQKL